LDTHALLWWFIDDPGLSSAARAAIRSRSNIIFVSAGSAWEIATKIRIGKLPQGIELASQFDAILVQQRFEPLPITTAHATRAGLLPGPHRDPFDRILIAQSQAENLPIISSDPVFDDYKLRRLWD